MNKTFRISSRLRSFRYAFAGLRILITTQHNAWIHAAATLGVVAAGFGLGVSAGAWCWLTLAIALVWVAEAFNTALERLADAASPDFHPLVRDAKDVSAGAVLLAAIGSVVIGILVFGPYVVEFVR